MLTLISCIIVILLTGFVLLVKKRHSYWKNQGVAQIDPEFFLGNFRKIVTNQKPFTVSFLDFYKHFKKLGVKHGGVYALTDPIYVPLDPQIIKNITQKDFQYFTAHGFYYPQSDVLSMNLFNLEGEAWKRLRVKLTPTFTSGKIKMMFDTLVEKTSGLHKLVDSILDERKPLQIKDVLGRYTTDIIGSCAFGIECNSLAEPDCLFRKYGLEAFNMNLLIVIIVSIVPWSILRAIGFTASPTNVTNFFTKMVKDTIAYREKNNIIRKDFMHLLIQLKNQDAVSKDDNSHLLDSKSEKESINVTEDEIIAQCFVFFLAGFETSSTTMTFALLELAQNQHIQSKLREEIRRVLKEHNDQITYDSVMEIDYLDKVINETLRKYPPLTTLPRQCTKRYQVPGTQTIIEKGTIVQIPVWGIQTDPEYYPNPEEFNPENFSEENKAKRPEFTFLPFGEGPRMCIGLRFGMLQTKVGLISLLTRYNFTINEKTHFPLKFDKNFVLAVKGDVSLNAKKLETL